MNTFLRYYSNWLLVCLLLAGGSVRAQNLALNKAAIASSQVQAASFAFDGNGSTRWESTSSDPAYLIVDLGSVQTIDRIKLTWETAYGRDFTLDISTIVADPSDASWTNVINGTWTTAQNVKGNSTTADEYKYLGKSGRYVRMRGTARGTTYGYSLWEFEVYNYSTGSNLALNKPATASTFQSGFPAEGAFDGVGTTRWGSQYDANLTSVPRDSNYVYVDLRGTARITQIILSWETAYGKDFKLEISDDAVNWKGLARVSNNTSTTNNIMVAGIGRYVRMHGLQRAVLNYGYSLWEFEVYGTMLTTLPVSLVSFKADLRGAAVDVHWATASEQRNAGFEVQRSADGSVFTTLAFVAGAGTSQVATAYDYHDAAPLHTTSYYRLKQLDTEGAVSYSPVVAVEPVALVTKAISVNLYPNPTADQAIVTWEAAQASAGRWYLTTATGQLVHSEALNTQSGLNTLALDLQAYKSGSYVLAIEAAGQAVHRTVVQKVN
jgi:hypothetical protein